MPMIYLVSSDKSFAGSFEVPESAAGFYIGQGHTTVAPGDSVTLNLDEFWQFDGEAWQPAKYPAEAEAPTRHVTDEGAVAPRDVSVITRDLLAAKLAAMRYAYETGGMVLEDGTPVKTGREDVTLLLAAYTRLQGRPAGTTTDWKAPTGWLTVTLEQLEPIWHACSDFISGAFSAERKVAEHIAQLKDEDLVAFDLRAAFAAATEPPAKTLDEPAGLYEPALAP